MSAINNLVILKNKQKKNIYLNCFPEWNDSEARTFNNLVKQKLGAQV